MHKGKLGKNMRWCNVWSDTRTRPSQLDRPMRLVNRGFIRRKAFFWGKKNSMLLSNLLLET